MKVKSDNDNKINDIVVTAKENAANELAVAGALSTRCMQAAK